MNSLIENKKAIFLDIDGTCIVQDYPPFTNYKALMGAVEKVNQWYEEGHKIIFTTAREEKYKSVTTFGLTSLGFLYHDILFDMPLTRIIINDNHPDKPEEKRAEAYIVVRDVGIGELKI